MYIASNKTYRYRSLARNQFCAVAVDKWHER